MKYKCTKAFTIEKEITLFGRTTQDYTHVEAGGLWKMVSCGENVVTLQNCSNGLERLDVTLGALRKYFERV